MLWFSILSELIIIRSQWHWYKLTPSLCFWKKQPGGHLEKSIPMIKPRILKRERERNTQRLQSTALPQNQTEWQPAIVPKGSISTKNQMTKLLMNEIFLLCWKNSGTAEGLRIKAAIWRTFLKDTSRYPSPTKNSSILKWRDSSGFQQV